MKEVDARKLNCPQPLILTKNALESGEKEVLTIVDNETARENILKFCKLKGFDVKVEEKNNEFHIKIVNENACGCELLSEEEIVSIVNGGAKGYLIGTDLLGNGSEELGALLMKGFIYSITQVKPAPKFMIFLNGGVKLTTEGSQSIDDLKQLLQAGTRIVSCGTCLDFYNIKDKLQVGEVTNMYDIVETIYNSDNVITLG